MTVRATTGGRREDAWPTLVGQASERISLNGVWGFQLDPSANITLDDVRPDRRIPVPMPWQAAFRELRQYSGYAWYERRFRVPGSWLGGDVRLRFGAVDYWCETFVNGRRTGEHEGGYSPFEFAVGPLLRAGENRLRVRVFDPAQTEIAIERWPDFGAQMTAASVGPPFVAQHIPHGKQEMYVNVGGIWQDVSLVRVPDVALERVRVTPDLDSGTAVVAARVGGGAGAGGARVDFTVVADGADVGHAALELPPGRTEVSATIAIPDPRPWSVEDPFLHLLHARVESTAGVSVSETRFGMRSFSVHDGGFVLNGQPIYLLAVLDQDLYPDTIYTVPSEAFLADQFRKARELGFNTLRCHIKLPDPRYLELADEMGLLVWTEIPSWRTFWTKGTVHARQLEIPAEVRRRVERTLEDMVARDHNHPSLVMRTLVNEDWGTALALSGDDRRWLRGLYERAKQLDPSRLVVDNSACGAPWGRSFHVKTDVDDFHVYAAIPDQAAAFTRAAEELALRPVWSFSTHGDAERRGDEPLVLSEFGNWGLPSLRSLRGGDAADPAWLDVGPWGSGWEVEPGWPSGVHERFQRFGLDRVWPDYEAFASATQLHQYEALKFEIETLRRQPALAGYVVTQLTDTYWESNGLLDFHRGRKARHDGYRHLNAPDVVVGVPGRSSYWSGEAVEVGVHLSHYSGRASKSTVLGWLIGDSGQGGELELAAPPRGGTARAGSLRFEAPSVTDPAVLPVRLSVADPAGRMAETSMDLVIYPRTASRVGSGESVAVTDGAEEASREAPMPEVPGQRATPDVQRIEVQTEPMGVQWETPGATTTPGHHSTKSLAERVARLGYEVTNLSVGTHTAIATSATARLLSWVRNGGRLLFLADGSSPFFWLQPRVGAYGGGWITSFSWLRPGVHPRLRERNPLGLEYVGLMPLHTIVGIPMDDPVVAEDILAGMVVGWVHHPTAHTVRFRYGRGKVVMTTFRLADSIGTHPTATAMFLDLLDEVRSGRAPTLASNY